MGIHNLSKVIAEHAANAVKEYEMKNLFGVKVAVDASMSLYQFLIAVRQDGNVLTNADGETTSHLVGLFYRTIRMIEHGIKPVYVFDGKPPTLKRGELAKRSDRRDEAQANLLKAREEGDAAEEQKLAKRLVKVTAAHNAEAKQLLRLMGIPVFEAPGEAEAQCAVLTNAGRVFATATDDMDALCFGARVLVRHLCASEARKLPIQEFRLEKVLSTMNLTFDSFIDLCILLGCDYCETIRGIGPKKAYELISKHKRLEAVFAHMNEAKPKAKSKASKSEAGSSKYTVPEDYPFEAVRELFRKPLVVDADNIPEFRWEMPDEEGLVQMLVRRFGFAEDRVRNNSRKLAKLNRTSQQSRIDSFFAQPSTESSSKETSADTSKKSKTKPQDSDSESETNTFNRRRSAKKPRLASSSESEPEEKPEAETKAEVKAQKKLKVEPSTPVKMDTSDVPKASATPTAIDENKNKNRDANGDDKPLKHDRDTPSAAKEERANVVTAEKSSPKDTKPEKARKTVNAFELLLKSGGARK